MVRLDMFDSDTAVAWVSTSSSERGISSSSWQLARKQTATHAKRKVLTTEKVF
jgi:hypothetical protein